jgi:hypothetical protein
MWRGTMMCPSCQHENREDANFCGECGHDLPKPEEPAPIDYNRPQSYTPKHLADKILSNRTAIEGERKLVTILFADVANSTAMFENLDPATSTRLWTGDLGFAWRIITFTGWHTG